MTDGLIPSLLYLGLAAVVLALKPGVPETRVFLFFSLTWFCTAALFPDSWTTYRFSALFLTAWAFAPAAYLHLALRFPRPRRILFVRPWHLWIAYLLSAVLALAIQVPMTKMPAAWTFVVPAVAATYWALAFIVLVASFMQSALWGATPLIRQRAKVLTAGFVAGPLLPGDRHHGGSGDRGGGAVSRADLAAQCRLSRLRRLRDGALRSLRPARRDSDRDRATPPSPASWWWPMRERSPW